MILKSRNLRKGKLSLLRINTKQKLLCLNSTGCKRRIRKTFEVKIWEEPLLVKKQTIPQQKALDLSFNLAP